MGILTQKKEEAIYGIAARQKTAWPQPRKEYILRRGENRLKTKIEARPFAAVAVFQHRSILWAVLAKSDYANKVTTNHNDDS